MRNIGNLALGIVLAALSVAALPSAGHAYTPEEQAACQPDAFRLCGSEIPNIERVKACMLARRAQLSPECKRYFRPDPVEPVAVAPPPAYAGRPVNIRPKTVKHAKPVAAKSASTKPAVKKPAAPKPKKPAKPAAT
jgi:hypothetical protein